MIRITNIDRPSHLKLENKLRKQISVVDGLTSAILQFIESYEKMTVLVTFLLLW